MPNNTKYENLPAKVCLQSKTFLLNVRGSTASKYSDIIVIFVSEWPNYNRTCDQKDCGQREHFRGKYIHEIQSLQTTTWTAKDLAALEISGNGIKHERDANKPSNVVFSFHFLMQSNRRSLFRHSKHKLRSI